jgi:hypothetical protein
MACRSRSIAIGTRSSGPTTLDEQLINKRPFTQLGRALTNSESPDLAGRRSPREGSNDCGDFFQDRLVSELRLAKAKTLEQAQAVLDGYLLEHNRKFSNPTQAQPAWRKANAEQIEQALCFKEKRTMANDNTITFDGVLFQIPKKSRHRSYANKRIDVHVLLDGLVELFYKQEKIAVFDSEKAHAFGLYRTNKKRESAMDLFPIYHP